MHTKSFKGYTLTNSILFYSKYFPMVHGTDLTTAFDNAKKAGSADMELAIDIFTAMAIAGTKELRDRVEEEGAEKVKTDIRAGIGFDDFVDITKAVTEVLGEKK